MLNPWRYGLLLMLPTFALATDPIPESSGRAERVDEILTQLQARSDGIKDIRTDVRFVEEDRINLTTRVKLGTVTFLMSEPNPRFMIHFVRTEVDGVVGKGEWYLFDGRWLYEVIERIGQVTQREFAPPGTKVDLFDLETAPFPMPFGQKKDAILRNFNVTLLPAQPSDPSETDHLECRPKIGSPFHGKYDSIQFFVHRTLHLPTRIVVIKNDGLETITADFSSLTEQSLNTGLKRAAFDPPKSWREKYRWVVEGSGASVESPARK